MSDNKTLVEYYEDVRDNYSEDVAKSAVFEKHKLPEYLDKLRSVKITVLDPKELMRVVFYLDDMMEHGILQEGTELSDWLVENMGRNPSFFNRYFKQSQNKTVSLKKPDEVKPEIKQEKRNIIPDLNNSDEEFVKKIWDQSEEDMIVIPYENELPHFVAEPTTKSVEQDVEIDSKDVGFQSRYLIETNMTELVTEVQDRRKQETALQLQKILESLTSVNLYDKPSMLAQLAETAAYKQVLSGILSELGIKSSITTITGQGVVGQNLLFNASHNYSIEEFKKGFAHGAVEIQRLKQLEKVNIELTSKLRATESSKLSLLATNSLLTSKISDLEKTKTVNSNKSEITKAQKLIYCYISWEEKSEDGTVNSVYLGSLDKTKISENGFYLTKYLIKADRTSALRFRSKKHALDQLNRVIKNYKHINVKTKISLKGHLKQAKLVLLLEEEEIIIPPVEKEQSKAGG